MDPVQFKVCDKSRAIVEPHLHDGRLLGLSLLDAHSVALAVATVAGNRYNIVLDGVVRFRASEFLEGNIILDITVLQGDHVRLDDIAQLEFEGLGNSRAMNYLKKVHERIQRESLLVVELNPSYGCHLIGVAKGISIEPAQ